MTGHWKKKIFIWDYKTEKLKYLGFFMVKCKASWDFNGRGDLFYSRNLGLSETKTKICGSI